MEKRYKCPVCGGEIKVGDTVVVEDGYAGFNTAMHESCCNMERLKMHNQECLDALARDYNLEEYIPEEDD